MKKKCTICGEPFTPTRSWSKYCSDKCRKKANSLGVIKCRKKPGLFKIKTLEEMKTKEPYKTYYKKIDKALADVRKAPLEDELSGEKKEKYLRRYKKRLDENAQSWLRNETGISPDALHRYIDFLRIQGKIEKNGFSPSQRFRFEALKLRQKDIIFETDIEHTLFHPSRGHSYIFYNPNINIDEIKFGVKDLDKRVKEVEYHLKEAQKEWINILSDARDASLSELWKDFLQNNNMCVLTNFDFCLDRIFERVKSLLWDVSRVSYPEKSFEEQWDTFVVITGKAEWSYIQKTYKTLNQRQINELYAKTERDFESNKDAFVDVYGKIIGNWSATKLEHLIVVDFLGIDKHRSKELKKIGLIVSSEIDERTVGEIDDELKKLSERKQPYDILRNKPPSKEHDLNHMDKERYIETPFFKKFFQGFEKDLKGLGFKKDGDNGLEEFYKNLDETATILRIPSLPDDPADLV